LFQEDREKKLVYKFNTFFYDKFSPYSFLRLFGKLEPFLSFFIFFLIFCIFICFFICFFFKNRKGRKILLNSSFYLTNKFNHYIDDINIVIDYLFYSNSSKHFSGEELFRRISLPGKIHFLIF
jgi:hypothetical protein